MHKVLSLSVALLIVCSMVMGGALAPRSVLAQEVGDTATVVDLDGNDLAEATVEDIIDPFEDFEQEPEPGLRFISIELTFGNIGEEVIELDPRNIGIVDDSGIIYTDVDVDRTDDIESLEAMDIEPGDDVTGGLEVGLPEDAAVAQIIWLVDTGIMPTLLNDAKPVDTGDEVSLFNTDYEEEAVFTVEEVVDEFDDLADDVELNDGFKFVGVTVTIENTGEEEFVPEPGSFFLADTDGVFWTQDASLVRSDDSLDELEDVTDDPIAPGDSVTGFLGFGTTDTSEIDYIMYLPSDFTRLIHLYDADSGSGGDDDASPTAEDDDDDNGGLGPIGKKTPTPEDEDNGNTGGDEECAGGEEWAKETVQNLNDWSAIFSALDPNNLDADELTANAEEIREIADAQAESDYPPAAEELNDAIVAAFEDSADALDKIAEGVETGDTALIGEGAEEITAVGTSFSDGEVAEILADTEEICPEISDL